MLDNMFFKVIIAGAAVIMSALIIICVGIPTYNLVDKENKTEKHQLEEYKQFKNDTEIIKGKVIEAKKEQHFIFPDQYNIVVKTKGNNSKLISVNEQEYRNYQVDSNAHFIIDNTDKNKIVRDLDKESDINNIRDFKKYSEKKHQNSLDDSLDSIFDGH